MAEGYLAFSGPRTEEVIRSCYVDQVLFSCKALDQERGIMESQESFASFKRAMIASSRKRTLVIDSTKFDQSAYAVVGRLQDLDVVITDQKPDDRWLLLFETQGVICKYPGNC
jgi:DeoR/GlpR family transcriptional regulator of sugar metabolism